MMKLALFRWIIGVLAFCSIGILTGWSIIKPRIFLIGDSISIQYYTYLTSYLSDVAQLERKEDNGQAEKNLDIPMGANGGDSRMVLAYLKQKVNDLEFKPDYLLLNCGLHDIKHDVKNGVIQVDTIEYRNNLTAIYQLLKNKGIKIVWIRTTPVIDSLHNTRSKYIRRYGADVEYYNHIADELCEKNSIPEIDLFTFSETFGSGQVADHVHFKPLVQMQQAAYISGYMHHFLGFTTKIGSAFE